KLARSRPLNWFGAAYTGFVRGTPEFLILLLIYFGSEAAVQGVLTGLGLDVAFEMPKFLAAVLGLAFIFGAYACEVFRGAFLAVPRGLMEAAESAGMTPWMAFRRVRMPLMWRYAIPGLGNLWMVMLKDTSLAAVIALDELLRIAKIAGETTRDPLLFFTAAGVLYLIMTAVSDYGRSVIERRARRGMPA
ncbi:MAG: ABC transporter permease subunit, partial [Rhizobiales bacterium]|nr:ABC transporter permease subunit [Hyphomicrobiales bacterium]